MSKHKSYDNKEFITIGFKQPGIDGEVIIHVTTVDADWFFDAVNELKEVLDKEREIV